VGHPDEHQGGHGDHNEEAAGGPRRAIDDEVIDAAAIDAAAIAARRFSVAFRGYDRGEVGTYLQRVAIAHKALADELDAARAALDEERRRTSVVGVSPNLDAAVVDELDLGIDQVDLREIDVTDGAVLPGEDDEVFDRMVRAALERAVRSDSPYGRA
jgi:DivIVA domain-containing protein